MHACYFKFNMYSLFRALFGETNTFICIVLYRKSRLLLRILTTFLPYMNDETMENPDANIKTFF